jgi:hypothetical protein
VVAHARATARVAFDGPMADAVSLFLCESPVQTAQIRFVESHNASIGSQFFKSFIVF